MNDCCSHDEPIGRVVRKIGDVDSSQGNFARDRQLDDPSIKDVLAQFLSRVDRLESVLCDKQRYLPEADRTGGKSIICKSLICQRLALLAQPSIGCEPNQRMGVEQNHFNAFHSVPIGEMMSPVTTRRPLRIPRAFRLRCLYGLSSTIGLPFFVITTLSPVRSTSSISARHLALNSEAFIIRDMG